MEISSVDCPKCGAGISDQIAQGKLFKCGNCGTTLVWPESQPKLVLSFGSRLCLECGIDNELNRNFCRNCGTALIKTCPACNVVFYVGDKFCPNGHEYDHELEKIEDKKKDCRFFLHEAEIQALKGNLEQASQVLDEAIKKDPTWAPWIAGFPYGYAPTYPASGYGLLVHLAGKTGMKQLAVQFFKRMLELNSKSPGDSNARQAARDANIENEAKTIARALNVSWHWWSV